MNYSWQSQNFLASLVTYELMQLLGMASFEIGA